MPARRAPTKPHPQIYELKITLAEIAPPIWRRVLVRGDVTFARLHLIIQDAMGWQNCHLHGFDTEGRRIGILDEESDDEDGRKLRLDRVVIDRGTPISYEYDFGDGWTHEIELEELLPVDPRVTYPICIAGARACPPEDCGGPHGYTELLEVLADPEHEEYDQMLAWVGGLYDPEGFDVNRVNASLRRLR